MKFAEKRNFFRLAVEIPVLIEFTQSEKMLRSRQVNGYIRNLGGGGIKLETRTRFRPKRRINVEFDLPFNDHKTSVQKFYLTAEVTRSEKLENNNKFSYGLKFVNILPPVQDRIVKYLFDTQISSRYHVKEVEA
jgi:c-di-GMP-binding flagellar brake protein YcgR